MRYVLLSAVLLIGCSELKVVTDYDKQVDFNAFDSFTILPWEQADSLINSFDKERIVNAVKTQMMNRGHAYDTANPELAIMLFLKLDNKTTTRAYTSHYGGYGYGYAYPGWGWGGGMTSTSYSDYHYTVGTLVVDVYETRTRQLIWQSVGAGTVDEDPRSRERSVPKAISYIFKRYPKPVQKL